MTAPLCALDTETTGLHADRQVWEVAAIRRDVDGTETEWHAYLDVDLETADARGLQVGRFWERHPLGRYLSGVDETDPRHWIRSLAPGPQLTVSRWEAATRLAKLTHGAHIVGAVPSFDIELVTAMLREHHLTPAWHYHLIDIVPLAAGHLAGQGRAIQPPWKSDDLARWVGVPAAPPEARHTALGDARWALNVYDAVMEGSSS